MRNKILLVHIFFLPFISGKECDKLGILIYEDMGCTPEYSAANTDCPLKYTCKGIGRSTEHCYFRGKSYTEREEVDNSLTSPSCDIACYCSSHEDRSARFICAILDCPEWLGEPLKPGCFRKYSVDECCSIGQVCPPFGTMETCLVEGKEYREGERFNPSNTCLDCVCQKGFKGKFEEPFCKKIRCGQQLRSDGQSIQASCAAFYNKSHNTTLCCPTDWICPNGNENFKGHIKSEESCHFGSKAVKVGQYFEKVNFKDGYGRSFEKVKCECAIPPLMKCNTA